MPLGAFARPPPLGLPVVEGQLPEPELDPFPALEPELDPCPPPEPEPDPFPPPEPEVELDLDMITIFTCALCSQQNVTLFLEKLVPRGSGTVDAY